MYIFKLKLHSDSARIFRRSGSHSAAQVPPPAWRKGSTDAGSPLGGDPTGPYSKRCPKTLLASEFWWDLIFCFFSPNCIHLSHSIAISPSPKSPPSLRNPTAFDHSPGFHIRSEPRCWNSQGRCSMIFRGILDSIELPEIPCMNPAVLGRTALLICCPRHARKVNVFVHTLLVLATSKGWRTGPCWKTWSSIKGKRYRKTYNRSSYFLSSV